MKKYIYLTFLLLLFQTAYTQKEDYFWAFGEGLVLLNVRTISLDFNNNPPVVTNYNFPLIKTYFRDNVTCISDSLGNFLFASNGIFVVNKLLDTMQNGMGLNLNGLIVPDYLPRSGIILPSLQNSNEYYLVHHWLSPSGVPTKLFYTKIDMSLDNGLGEVVQKNIPLLSDSLGMESMQAVRHANGRDWWILCPKHNSTAIYTFLYSNLGFQNKGIQNVGYANKGLNMAQFSPDGKKYVQYLPEKDKVRIHDFDRCSGLLKGYSDIYHPFSLTIGAQGIVVSPNSHLLYINNQDTVFQYDMTATNIEATEKIAAISDHFIDSLGRQDAFYLPQLAPDGKIYISSFINYIHVINSPDSVGTACNLVQRQINVKANVRGLPNLPNYRLGRDIGSACDTVFVSNQLAVSSKQVEVYPNPASGRLQLSASEDLRGSVSFYNLLGERKKSLYLAGKSVEIAVSDLAEGLYLIKIETETGEIFSQKIVIER